MRTYIVFFCGSHSLDMMHINCSFISLILITFSCPRAHWVRKKNIVIVQMKMELRSLSSTAIEHLQ